MSLSPYVTQCREHVAPLGCGDLLFIYAVHWQVPCKFELLIVYSEASMLLCMSRFTDPLTGNLVVNPEDSAGY